MQQAELFVPTRRVESVSRVVDYIRRVIAGNKTLAGIRVRGEVSGRIQGGSGALYFYLKENNDVLKCMAWPKTAQKLPPFKDGDEVICGGDFDAYTVKSEYELIVNELELGGTGALYAQYEALKTKLRQEGLFDAQRKRPFPAFPRRIAVVSAPEGRGIEDFFTTMRRRAPFVTIVRVDSRVQGDGAEIDIAEAIDKASKLDVDAIVVTRGGGSYEDLFPFNREAVVRAIVRAKHPVLSAIGHTADVHLSDLAADKSCETPSNAAQFFGGLQDEFIARIERALSRMRTACASLYGKSQQRFDDANGRLQRAGHDYTLRKERTLTAVDRRMDFCSPQRRLQARGESLTAARMRLESTARYLSPKPRLELLDARLAAVNPQSPLERGYAIVTYRGRAVREAMTVPAGSEIEAKVHRGALVARVEKTIDDER